MKLSSILNVQPPGFPQVGTNCGGLSTPKGINVGLSDEGRHLQIWAKVFVYVSVLDVSEVANLTLERQQQVISWSGTDVHLSSLILRK